MVSFSFSTLQDQVAKVFEPGATPPSKRLKAVESTMAEGFLTGISLMPLIPFVSDTTEQLNLAFSTFQQLKVDYILPATLTLFGKEKASSKTLMLNAIEKHYPQLSIKYKKFFSGNHEMPLYYRQAFRQKMNELCAEYSLENSIINAALKKSTLK